jgi:hypothetical protein
MLIASSSFSNFHVSQAYSEVSGPYYTPIPHYVFTELSTRLPSHWAWSDNPYDPCHQEWLQSRIMYCREKLVNSINIQAFKLIWKVIVHPYPEDILRQITSMLGIDRDSLILCDRSFSDDASISQRFCVSLDVHKYMYQEVSKGFVDGRFIISKIDSDDWYTADFSLYVQLAVKSIEKNIGMAYDDLILDFPNGSQYIEAAQAYLSTIWSESGFVNLVSNADRVKNRDRLFYTPFSFSHDRIPAELSKILVTSMGPAWISSVHSSNISNDRFFWSYDPLEKTIERITREPLLPR